jgi:hypothetical protein
VSLPVSKDTDITVRSFLARRGMKKGDLSKFIEEAVKWRVHDQTLAAAGSADFLVTGDRRDLLGLRLYAGCRIITVRDFFTLTRRLQ